MMNKLNLTTSLPPGPSRMASLGRAFDQFGDHLRRVADRGLRSDLAGKVGASDVVQDTFFAASRDLAAYQGQTPREFRGWLEGILHHRLAYIRRQFRQSGKRKVSLEVPMSHWDSAAPHRPDGEIPARPTPSPLSQVVLAERIGVLRAALGELTDAERQMIHWRHQDRLKFAAIGGRLGISEEAARKRWVRAMAQLREVMEDHDDLR